MKFLSAPWRWDFISKISKKKGCIFCDALKLPESESLIPYKGENYFIILNKYPYNTGHLMIVPYKHVSYPDQISPKESMEMWELMNKSMAVLKKRLNPMGFNLGMNLGSAAGAGVKDHIHIHIVPRWAGDANFMPIIGKTDVVSYDIKTVFDILQKEFNQ